MNWDNNILNLANCLKSLSIRNKPGTEIEADLAFAQLKDLTIRIREAGRTIYLIGNGASASMASHVAADLAKNAYIRTEIFTDLSLITAIANDFSYEDVFAELLRRRMTDGDILVAISSSGQSPNVLSASQVAMLLGGYVVTLSAMRPDNFLRSKGNLNFYVPAETYGAAETSHAAILHYWIDTLLVPRIAGRM